MDDIKGSAGISGPLPRHHSLKDFVEGYNPHIGCLEGAMCEQCGKNLLKSNAKSMELNLHGWFPPENEETLAKLIKDHDIKTVIEIGCFLGKSTKFFVEQGCSVISIDTFKGASDLNGNGYIKTLLPTLEEQFRFNLKALGIEDKVKVMPMSSEDAFRIINERADMVFIDGSHEYQDVHFDIKNWKIMAKKVLCGDDYTPHYPGVREAVDELLPNANKGQRVWFNIQE